LSQEGRGLWVKSKTMTEDGGKTESEGQWFQEWEPVQKGTSQIGGEAGNKSVTKQQKSEPVKKKQTCGLKTGTGGEEHY